MARWLVRVTLGLFALAALAVLVVVTAAATVTLPGERLTPAGLPRNQAVYVTMPDGVRIAVDVWLPSDFAAGARVPVLMHATRYWRATDLGLLARAGLALGLVPEVPTALDGDVDRFSRAGFVVLLVDARGSGASFGRRLTEWSPDERADYGRLADWAAAQPWSNGAVGTWGVSYAGNTAEIALATGSPALRAAAPLYGDWDPWLGLVAPGGAPNVYVADWGALVAALDRNDVCGASGVEGVACIVTRLFMGGVKPVDADADRTLLADAVGGRDNIDVAATTLALTGRDATLGASGLTLGELAPYGLSQVIAATGVPRFVRVGWLDAGTVDGALVRFAGAPESQRLVIGSFSHGGRHDTDPFAPVDRPVSPSVAEQYDEYARFFAATLNATGPGVALGEIRYATLGTDVWRGTRVWPPSGLSPLTLYLAAQGALSETPPSAAGEAVYAVDFSASTGGQTRWHTNLGRGDVVYGDRAVTGGRRATWSSAPLPAAIEVTGAPELTLHLASSRDEAVVHAYLEIVDPAGRSTYVTEGVLNAAHRAVGGPVPYPLPGPPRGFLTADRAPLPVGVSVELRFPLIATSVLVPRGHRLRLTLAGADAGMFPRVPAEGGATWRISSGPATPSRLVLPAAIWPGSP